MSKVLDFYPKKIKKTDDEKIKYHLNAINNLNNGRCAIIIIEKEDENHNDRVNYYMETAGEIDKYKLLLMSAAGIYQSYKQLDKDLD